MGKNMAEVHVNITVSTTQNTVKFHNPAVHLLAPGSGQAVLKAGTANPNQISGQVSVSGSNGPIINNPA